MSVLARLDVHAVRYAIAGVDGDQLARAETARDLGLCLATVTDPDRCELGSASIDAIDRPPIAVTEQGSDRHLRHLGRTPERNSRPYAISVPERQPERARIGQRDDDVHALLVDAERRDLRERRRLYPQDLA